MIPSPTFPDLNAEARKFIRGITPGIYCDGEVSKLIREPKRIAEIIYGEPLAVFDLASAKIHVDDDIAETEAKLKAMKRAQAALDEIMIGRTP